MKKSFTIGALAGISSLVVAIPLLAQFANAASPSSVSSVAAQQTQTTTATVNPSAAEQTALTVHPGKLSEAARIDSRMGGYKVEVTANDGNEYDVIVDATTGQITDSWIDDQGGPKGGHGPRDFQDNAPADAEDSSSSL